MKHLDHLQNISSEDVNHLLMKERTYGGSWKKRGGVGAFMMLARKWDRIENVLASPRAHTYAGVTRTAASYDIFGEVEANPSGTDGTVLAEVRDLRRYLLLVEAEMVARGVVATPPAAGGGGEQQCRVPRYAEHVDVDTCSRCGGVISKMVMRVVKDGKLLCVSCAEPPTGPRDNLTEIEPTVHNPDADGAQHASLVPWAVNTRWRYKHDMQVGGPRAGQFDACYNFKAPGVWVLDHVLRAPPPGEVRDLYVNAGNTWFIKIAQCPPDARGWFPYLRRELNQFEYDALSEDFKPMYVFSTNRDGGGEYTLVDSAWGREAQGDAQ